MHERFTPGQIKIAKGLSRRFEKSWRVITYPERYSFEEANKTMDFFEKEGREIVEFVDQKSPDSEMINLLNSVFLGLFHRNITIPLEFKPRSPNVN
jgi:predicted site-specific integrase-resolvase